MAITRAALFDENDIDLSEFTPGSRDTEHFPSKNEVRRVSEQAGFPSREPTALTDTTTEDIGDSKNPIAGRKKPYNASDVQKVQLNIRVLPNVADEFYRISKENDWSLGQTLKNAISALRDQSKKPA